MRSLIILVAFLLYNFSVEAGERIVTTSDGVDLYVKIEGSGNPLLYVHGGPGSGSYWFEKLFGDFMEQHFKMVYLDQRGVGRSESAANKDYSLDRMVLDFEEVRTQLGFDSWLTIGHSFGGILQMAYADQYPEAVKGMLMVNCTMNLTQSACTSWIPKAAEIVGEKYTCVGDSLIPAERIVEFGGKLRSKNLFWKLGSSDPSTFLRLDEISSELQNFNHDFGRHAFDYPEYWRNYKPLSSKMKMPVLYFYGTKDHMVGPKHYEGLDFQNLLLWRNEGGHIPFIEDKNDLKKAILTFIEKYEL